MSDEKGGRFREGKRILDELSGFETARVCPGEQKNQGDRGELFGRQADGVATEEMDRIDEIMFGGDGRGEDSHKLRKSNRDRGDGARLNDEKERPAEKKTERRTVGFAEKNINTSGARHHRRQFRATERAGDRHQTGDGPGQQQPSRPPRQPRRFRRGDEDAGTDHRADHDHGRVERAEAPFERSALPLDSVSFGFEVTSSKLSNRGLRG